MRTSEVLNRAADRIQADGWTKGTKGMSTAAGDPHCILGAIGAVIGADTFISGSGIERYSYFETRNCPAALAVEDYLMTTVLDEWNDEPGRSAGQVIETLRAAALAEGAREDATLLAEVGAP